MNIHTVELTVADTTVMNTKRMPDVVDKTVEKMKCMVVSTMKTPTPGTSELDDVSELASDWNLHFKSGAGGVVAFNNLQTPEKDAVDGLLQMHSKKSHARVALKLTMCKGMPGSKCPLAKWHVNTKCKELKLMENLVNLCSKFNPNTNGILHPYLKFSSVKLPRTELDEFVETHFKNRRGFLVFTSSIGMSKSKINVKEKSMAVLRFSPKAWNKNGHRLSCAHQRKPIIEPVQCELDCCKGKWDDAEWLDVKKQFV